MESIDTIKQKFNEYVPEITVEDFIVWMEAFLDDLKDAKKDYEKEKRRHRNKRFFRLVEFSVDDDYYSELDEVLDEGIRITLVMKDFAARVVPIASDKNAKELFKLMKYAADFYFKYTDKLDKKMNAIDTKYYGISVSYPVEGTGGFESFMSNQIDQEEEKSIPQVSRSEMESLNLEYDSYVVDERFSKSTEEVIFLWMRLDEQMKFLEKKEKKYARKSDICDKIADFLNSEALSRRSCIFEEMEILTQEERDILAFIRSASNGDNLDEMRKLADFFIHYYGEYMNALNEELGTTIESNHSTSNERRRAAIKRFVMHKIKQIPKKQIVK